MMARLHALARLRVVPAAVHVLQKMYTLSIGRVVVSRPWRSVKAVIDRKELVLPPIQVAVVAHAYYPDLIPEILRCRAFLPSSTPTYLTVPPEKVNQAVAIIGSAPNVTVISSPNRGRDIAPFLSVLRSGVLDPYEAVLKLHTKRSPHLLDGDTRRRLLFNALCGSRRQVAQTIGAFSDPKVGLAGWRSSFRTAASYWMGNRLNVEALASRMGIKKPICLGFFEGSMFWVRPAALTHLRRLDLALHDFDPETGQVDGALHHAIERLFTVSAWAGGFSVCDLKGQPLTGVVHSDIVADRSN
jgi:lipopolysaccharide biosynthesis protein